MLALLLFGFGLFFSSPVPRTRACAQRPAQKIKQVLTWDTQPKDKIMVNEITPFLATVSSSKNTGEQPSCNPSYRVTKPAGSQGSAKLDSKALTLKGTTIGIVTLIASCPADASFLAASISANVEIIDKPRANLEFIPYTDGTFAEWEITEALAKTKELVIDQPSYSMVTYIQTKLPSTPISLPIPDKPFIKINDQRPSPSQLKYKLKDDGASYLLELAYQEKPANSEAFLAVRVIKPSTVSDPTKSYSIKNADDLLKNPLELSGDL